MLVFHATMDQGFPSWIRVFCTDFSQNDGSGFSMPIFYSTMDQGLGFKFHSDFSHNTRVKDRVGCFYSWQLLFLCLY